MEDAIIKFADMINECNNIVFFGGAGVSTESGVKDYRSKDGLYNTVKDYGIPPEEILSRSFFFRHPDVFYDFYKKYFIVKVEPNDAHKALAELERMGKLKAVITQNIDGLHRTAGSKNVIELHGTTSKYYCHECKRDLEDIKSIEQQIINGEIPKCPYCKGIAKPRVVLYEEPLYEGVAESAVGSILIADMLIVGGTSLAVQPAASFVSYFKGKYTVMINKSETSFDSRADLVIRDSIGKVFGEVMKRVKQ
ncbi:MAG: NAD-dependent protein deacylase [Clostridia bacterium]|nr:NAD-dependent protein deacylase [Clostridia bacterium]